MRPDLKSGIFFLIISLLIIWESLRVELGTFLSPGSGFLSFGIGVILCFLSIVLILKGLRIKVAPQTVSIRVALALISLFIYSLILEAIGFLIPTFFLVFVLFNLGQKRSLLLTICISLVVTLLAYLIFGSLLHVYFPKGILGI